MSIFSEDFLAFFQELQGNNHKGWFDANRKRYEKEVKEPFKVLVTQLIDLMNERGAGLAVESKDCILRINRDIRFAKDKSPYNPYVTAFISAQGRKDKSAPGFPFRLSAEGVFIMVGSYAPTKEQLLAIRRGICSDPEGFLQLVREPGFSGAYGGLQGEQNKRIPAEFKDLATSLPLLANKQFYFMATLPAAIIPTDDLVPDLIRHWELARPVVEWFGRHRGT